MEISKNIFNTGRNMAGDRSYSSIDIIEEPYQKKKKNLCWGGGGGGIILCRKGLPVVLKIAKGRQVLSSEFIWENNPVVIVSYCPKP